MKSIRTLLIAVSALVFVNLAQAAPPGSPDPSPPPAASPAVTGGPASAPYSADPMVQKRQSDSIAKTEYKARKKAAKKKMKAEKSEAKADLKTEKAESTDSRTKAMASEPK
jgi:hypothetical protein